MHWKLNITVYSMVRSIGVVTSRARTYTRIHVSWPTYIFNTFFHNYDVQRSLFTVWFIFQIVQAIANELGTITWQPIEWNGVIWYIECIVTLLPSIFIHPCRHEREMRLLTVCRNCWVTMTMNRVITQIDRYIYWFRGWLSNIAQ